MECHFVKLNNDDIQEDKIQHQILVSQIKNTSMKSLYALINKIYFPLLVAKEDKRDPNNEKGNQI